MFERRAHLPTKATLVLLGTIIGAGVFGLPAMFSYVGFWPGTILFWIMVLVVLATHLLFTEVILYHKQRMRLAGYAGAVLGKGLAYLASVTFPLSLLGTLLAYVILGGNFLASIANAFSFPVDQLAWQMVFLVGGAAIVLFGLRFVAKVETYGTWALIATMVTVILLCLPLAKWDVVIFSRWTDFLVPYGVFLFSVGGLSVIAETIEIVQYKRAAAYQAVMMGTLGAAILSWAFGTALALAGGIGIGSDPSVLVGILPVGFGLMIPIVGFLAIATSFITIAEALKATLHIDFKLDIRFAWTLTFLLPLVLLLFIRRDFLSIISLVGTLFGGINGILVAMMAYVVLKKQQQKVKPWLHSLYRFGLALPVIVGSVYLIGILQKLLS